MASSGPDVDLLSQLVENHLLRIIFWALVRSPPSLTQSQKDPVSNLHTKCLVATYYLQKRGVLGREEDGRMGMGLATLIMIKGELLGNIGVSEIYYH